MIAGGRPRGVLYGVYDFLERYCSVYFLDEYTVQTPVKTNLILPDNVSIRKKPFFFWRYTVSGTIPRNGMTHMMSLLHGRLNYAFLPPAWGGVEMYGAPGITHTSYAYSKDFPKDKKEYFSLVNGHRLRPVNGGGPGQICVSHPEVQRLMYDKLVSFIKRDRTRLKDPARFPRFYTITHNDNVDYCRCKSCDAYLKKGANPSDLQIRFINVLARKLQKDYPGVKILTFAYTYTLKPPVFEKPLDNVIIWICNLSGAFSSGFTETSRAIKHPANKEFHEYFQKWKSISKEIFVWDYWILYNKPHIFPFVITDRCFKDMRYFAENKVRGIFVENEDPFGSFNALRHWILNRLMVDPFESRENILTIFFNGYYGPAQKPMREYFDLLERSLEAEKGSFDKKVPSAITYLKKDFFVKVNSLLDQAEKMAGKDAELLARIRRERVCVDMTAIRLGIAAKNQRKVLIDRMEKTVTGELTVNNPKNAASLARWKNLFDFLRLDVPLPKQFKGKNCVDFIYPVLKAPNFANVTLVKDPEATGGNAFKIGQYGSSKTHKVPFTAGLYNRHTRKFGPPVRMNTFPQDEKYHLYKIGSHYDLQPGTSFWAPSSWSMQVRLDSANAGAPVNFCDVYASIKFTGPVYVKGSKKEDAVYVDRIIVVKE